VTGTIGTDRTQPSMAISEPVPYVGRFAPSPTGPMHFGSLLAAVASYLQARSNNGKWLLRIEDIDPPREQAGATDLILFALESYEFEWDGAVSFQSASHNSHKAAVQDLVRSEDAYHCGCSRRDLSSAKTGPLGTIYPGTCRAGCDAAEFAIRVRTNDDTLCFDDRLQGTQSQRLESASGDFIIQRRDGLIAYQLAVVVDDYEQGITEVVRGIDLMDSTPRQLWLQQLLGFRSPSYLHIPVAIFPNGQKLSKNTAAPGIPVDRTCATLVAALHALGQQPPDRLEHATLGQIWTWAQENWHPDPMEQKTQILVDSSAMAAVK
jgi:glutamyl-Q tRNA(Asp) synthetase